MIFLHEYKHQSFLQAGSYRFYQSLPGMSEVSKIASL